LQSGLLTNANIIRMFKNNIIYIPIKSSQTKVRDASVQQRDIRVNKQIQLSSD